MSNKENRKLLIKAKLDQLEKLVSKMDIPGYVNKRNVTWLKKHLAVKNQNHSNYAEAKQIVEDLLRQGVTSG
jgi:hypothetical protein